MTADVLVIGAGLAGLTAAWQAATHKFKTRLITKGWGGTHWGSGCVGVLGYLPALPDTIVDSPEEAIRRLVSDNPGHPYALVGIDAISEALEAFKNLCNHAGYPMHGSVERNWLLPSAAGAIRPTCLAPETMIEGDLRRGDPMLIVGLDACMDFCSGLVADNLEAQGFPARHLSLDLTQLRERKVMNSVFLARMFERENLRVEMADLLKPKLGDAARVGFPAVLGFHKSIQVKRDLEDRLQRPVFEIPMLPPSVPGIRWHSILVDAIYRAGGQVLNGMQAISADTGDGRVTTIWSEAAARRKSHRSRVFVLATGGILGGGIEADYGGQVREVVCDLPVWAPKNRAAWFRRDFLDQSGHSIFHAGLEVNPAFLTLDGAGRVVYQNLLAVGTGLAHCDVLLERAFEGVALATGFQAGKSITSRLAAS